MIVRPRLLLVAAASLLSAACAINPALPPVTAPPVTTPTQPPVVVAPPKPVRAAASVVSAVAPRSLLPDQAERALAAFRLSCPQLVRRPDPSGLTTGTDWQALCAEAALVFPGGAKAFFEQRFEWVRVGSEPAFATGYYEPEILGSRLPAPGYAVPIYRTPPDLVRCTRIDGRSGRGRIDETGQCVLYFTRAEVEDGALSGKLLELAFAADPIELFFVEIQGSGRLRLPDGSVMRIGYDGQNGRDYVAIGKLLRERGLLPPGGANTDAIKAWMRAQPDGGKALMRENTSYIFFKELTGPGPLGALGVPVTPRSTVAADPLFIPLGAPVWLDMDRNEADGLWIAQDTGGAIKGANRVDTFWGAGDEAHALAGGMAAKGEALLLLPRGTVARVQAAQAAAAAGAVVSAPSRP